MDRKGNILFLSVGRRGELIKDFKRSLGSGSVLIGADCSPYAPALYFADKRYLVPKIDAPDYIDKVLEICRREGVSAVTTLIDPEIALLAKARDRFTAIGVEVLAPYPETAELCFDKFKMFRYLRERGIRTVETWGTSEEFLPAYEAGEAALPVFVKPRTGSGSVGAHRVDSLEELRSEMSRDPSLIVQELMDGLDMDADVYIDTVSRQAVSAFSKRKLESRIGGASKTVSFKDPVLFRFIREICSVLEFNGPVDMDFFYKDGAYYLSEVNPRFGGAYLHAYGAGVDFIKLIEKNLRGEANEPRFGDYEEGVVMMMYDSVVIVRPEELESVSPD